MNADSQKPAVEASSEPTSTRLIATLGLAGLFSGLVLVGVYELTLPLILANQARALQEAVFKVLPGIERMQEMTVTDGGDLTPTEEDQDAEEVVYAGYDASNQLLGYAIPGEGAGFQDAIRLIYGYKPDERVIIGMEVLESRETPGLGDKIIKDAAFRESFGSLAVDPEIVPVAPGASASPNEIDTITGATISSKAVVKIINAANERWLTRLEKPASIEPETQEKTKDDSSAKQEQQEER
jgi:electron transport complex protein RnfG